ncbi:MAG: T9SS type A sorting domain-containing protein [Candidatus Marinimicrobia bacterium]|nr:T9SS type A sorting domain-containing protein [Candidatus Neomarinimicrobiota bacterium]
MNNKATFLYKKFKHYIYIGLGVGLLNATQVTIPSSEDTWITDQSPGGNYCSDNIMLIGEPFIGDLYQYTGLAKFNIDEYIPAGSCINSVILRINCSFYNFESCEAVDWHEGLDGWNECEVTWDNRPELDYPVNTAEFCGIGWVTFPISPLYGPEFRDLVHQWLDNPGQNYGIGLNIVPGDEGWAGFYTSDNGNLGPELIIDYTDTGAICVIPIDEEAGECVTDALVEIFGQDGYYNSYITGSDCDEACFNQLQPGIYEIQVTANMLETTNVTYDLPPCYEIDDDIYMDIDDFLLPKYSLLQNYPNPFNPTTTISFELPFMSDVTITVYDLNGDLVEKLIDKALFAGQHNVLWDAGNRPSGLYFVKMIAGEHTETQKIVLLK